MLLSLRRAAQAALASRRVDAARDRERVGGWIRCWTAWTGMCLSAGYRSAVAGANLVPSDPSTAATLLRALMTAGALDAIADEEGAASDPGSASGIVTLSDVLPDAV
jgi:hypothetical protein